MKESKSLTFIILTGLLIVCIFTVVCTINLTHKNVSYYAKDNVSSAKIISYKIESSNLYLEMENAAYYCIKTTKTVPDNSSLCWKENTSNESVTGVYSYKTYYVWVKDSNGNISDMLTINS